MSAVHWSELAASPHEGTRHAAAQCTALFRSKPEAPGTWPPPHMMPPALRDRYTMGGAAKVGKWIADEKQNGAGQVWNETDFHGIVRACKAQKRVTDRPPSATCAICCCYNKFVCMDAMASFREEVRGARTIVLGSMIPWAESMLLALNAAHVTSIEYARTELSFGAPPSTRPAKGHLALSRRWAWQHPSEVARAYLDGAWQPADIAVSYSSLEHDGLGRYGDPLNPEGDLQSINKTACLLRPGGLFFLGFPVGRDAVIWNAHRIYGSARLKLVFAGWEVLKVFGLADTSNRQGSPEMLARRQQLALRYQGQKKIPWKSFPPQPMFVMRKPRSH